MDHVPHNIDTCDQNLLGMVAEENSRESHKTMNLTSSNSFPKEWSELKNFLSSNIFRFLQHSFPRLIAHPTPWNPVMHTIIIRQL